MRNVAVSRKLWARRIKSQLARDSLQFSFSNLAKTKQILDREIEEKLA